MKRRELRLRLQQLPAPHVELPLPVAIGLALRAAPLLGMPFGPGETPLPRPEAEQAGGGEDVLMQIVLPAPHGLAVGPVATPAALVRREQHSTGIVGKGLLRGHPGREMTDAAEDHVQRVQVHVQVPFVAMHNGAHVGPAQRLDPFALMSDGGLQDGHALRVEDRVLARLRGVHREGEDDGVETARVAPKGPALTLLLLGLPVELEVAFLHRGRGRMRRPQLVETRHGARHQHGRRSPKLDVKTRALETLGLGQNLL